MSGSSVACLEVNIQTDWFSIPFAVEQGDVLHPPFFIMYINNLALEMNESDVSIHMKNLTLGSILSDADDPAFLPESENDLQNLLILK